MADDITEAIRAVLRDHGRLSVDVEALDDHSNLYEAGLTSHASVNLMLALEDHFEVEFSDRMLSRDGFASIAAIRSGLDELTGASA
ncbi:MAG TPA: acyl carrier protein [Gemmatimonadaceae bacterium]|jgi:acyl carrier protein|nr:acyl carrier protein [Gemmatimonadaceae bacterium]